MEKLSSYRANIKHFFPLILTVRAFEKREKLMNVVIDKSYLQGSSKNEIHLMCLQHQLIMPEVLFLEILTTKTENMVKCFKKFPEIENPVALVPNVGTLIRYETERDSPCSPIETQFLQIRYMFNERLAKNQFVFTEEQRQSLKEWEESANEGTRGFIEKAIVTDGWFPELSGYRPGGSPNLITNAMDIIATDLYFVRKIYSQLRDEIYKTYKVLWPKPHRIDKEWILLRYLQVHLLAAIEYIRKFGKEPPSMITKRLENEYLDLEYCVIGTLCDGLATRDRTMAAFYKLLCPDKALIS